MLALLPTFRRALDLGCGTGRLTQVLAQYGDCIGMDTSLAMLAQAQSKTHLGLTQGDAYSMPYANASFDVVVALRLFFHFANLEPLLRQIARAVTDQGTIIFDTYLWSPRAWTPLDRDRWGESVFIHSPSQVENLAKELDLRVERQEFCFLFSPYIYRRLPLKVIQVLARVETWVPTRLRARVFWKLVRTN